MKKIEGFCRIKENATTCKGALNPEEFIGKRLVVVEFGVDDSPLVLNPKGTALAMFDKEDMTHYFRCNYINGIVIPPDLDPINEMLYLSKAINRKGGYPPLIANMVIEASLLKGKFTDGFLWQLQ
jgi:hypothetical protein